MISSWAPARSFASLIAGDSQQAATSVPLALADAPGFSRRFYGEPIRRLAISASKAKRMSSPLDGPNFMALGVMPEAGRRAAR